jgi:hypothetical protein
LVLRSVGFPGNRVRSIDDQKRIIVPDWMDCTEVPETQDEPQIIVSEQTPVRRSFGAAPLGKFRRSFSKGIFDGVSLRRL